MAKRSRKKPLSQQQECLAKATATENPYHLHLVIPKLPQQYNQLERKSFWARRKERGEWHALVAMTVGKLKPETPLSSAKIICIRHSSNCGDFDGIVSSFKFVIDGLVQCGVLIDDRPSILGFPTYDWEKAPKGQGFIEVIVEERNGVPKEAT